MNNNNEMTLDSVTDSISNQDEAIWDPIQQIYINGIVPQQKCIQELLKKNNGSIRIFGYGSLCWNPGIPGQSALADPRVTQTLGMAIGYRRVWAQRSTDHRGTTLFPGVVCTLLTDDEYYSYRNTASVSFDNQQETSKDTAINYPTSMTEGVLFEVPKELVDECLQELDFREKGVRFFVCLVCCRFCVSTSDLTLNKKKSSRRDFIRIFLQKIKQNH
jgi:cation transport regulator ChaC